MTHRAKKRFGQHFLNDQNVISKIIHCINPGDDDHIVEIGPGLGALTCPMLKVIDHIDVIELDRDVIPVLKRNCGDHEGLTVHQNDILKFDIASITNDKKIRVIGNLPYNISTAVLFHLLKYRDSIIDMHFMLQKEVVDRITAAPGSHDYGRLSVMMQTWFDTTALFDVSANCFSPPPKVESAIIQLIPADRYSSRIVDSDKYADLVRFAFAQRRKTLRNTLKPVCSSDQINQAGIDPGIRAEQLGIDDFMRLHEILSQDN